MKSDAIDLLPLALLSLALAGPAHADQPRPGSMGGTVIVTGTREDDDYRVPTLDSIGPLGTTPLLDTPYSIAVLPGI